jgi:nitrite reductase (cytochrome c-552)
VEYYFKDKTYLTFPWAKGTTVEGMLEYYNAAGFSDWTHAVSKTPMLKAQHPDWELYRTGIHAYRSVACADCHMPYISEGGVKFTDHHVQSPLLAVSRSCAVCHRWSEDEVRLRVTAIQQKVEDARKQAEDVLAKAHFDIAAAMQAGAADEALEPVRQLVRRAQFRWDYVAANNGMGFHSPQESMRILGDASREAQEARLSAARIMAAKGISAAPAYPDISTRDKAAAVTAAFVDGQPPALLPSGGPTP